MFIKFNKETNFAMKKLLHKVEKFSPNLKINNNYCFKPKFKEKKLVKFKKN